MNLNIDRDTFQGLREAQNQFGAMPFLFRVNVDIAGRSGVASLVRRLARQRAPGRTGKLKRTLRVRRDSGDYEGVRVSNFDISVRAGGRGGRGNRAFYGIFVDAGTSSSPRLKKGQDAQRFLTGVPDILTSSEVVQAYTKGSQRRMERFYSELQSGKIKRSTRRLFAGR